METKSTRTLVTSSAVRSVGYNPETKVLSVEMHPAKGSPAGTHGKVYDYPGVEPADHEKFMNAESMGKHLASHIRPKFSVAVSK